MTDGKGAGEGPYKHYRLCDEAPCVKGSCMACVYAAGRKAERERCLEIVRQYYSCEMIAQAIEKKIMGGQDAK